jgi:hypothetical protein
MQALVVFALLASATGRLVQPNAAGVLWQQVRGDECGERSGERVLPRSQASVCEAEGEEKHKENRMRRQGV